MSSSNCCFLTCIYVSQEAGQVVWYSHLFQNFPQFIVIHTVKGFGIVNKAEMDVFLELSCFFDDPADVGNLISCSSAFSKTSLNIWKFSVHVLLKPGLETFERYYTRMWDECNCAVSSILHEIWHLHTLWNDHKSNYLSPFKFIIIFWPYALLLCILYPCGIFILKLEVCTSWSPSPASPLPRPSPLQHHPFFLCIWVCFHFVLFVLFFIVHI